MLVADISGLIDHQQSRDASELEQIPFLAVEIGDCVAGVRQTDEGQAVFVPIVAISVGAIGANRQDFRVTRGEGRVIIAQAREMGAAVRSHKAAQEGQDEIFLAFEIRKAIGLAVEIREFEIGGGGVSHQCSVQGRSVYLFTCFRKIRARLA